MGIRSECWCIQPLSCPRLWRYCPSCGEPRAFVCSEKFRVNSNGKSTDVWLKYRCGSCESTWKLPLLERQSVASVDASLLDAFMRHDQETVWRHAFDVQRLRSHAITVDGDVEIRVERRLLEMSAAQADELHIRVELPFTTDRRLDRLLSQELGISRSTLQVWESSSALQVLPQRRNVLARPVQHGQHIMILGKAGELNVAGGD